MKRVMCMACEGEGDFLVTYVYPNPGQPNYVDCTECRGLGWVPPEEDEDEDRD